MDVDHAELERVARERFGVTAFRPGQLARLRARGVSLFVVDEAHCASQWGHDFRPAYLGLRAAIAAPGHPTALALTATSPPGVTEDILAQLGIAGARVVSTGIERPDLRFVVRPEDRRFLGAYAERHARRWVSGLAARASTQVAQAAPPPAPPGAWRPPVSQGRSGPIRRDVGHGLASS